MSKCLVCLRFRDRLLEPIRVDQRTSDLAGNLLRMTAEALTCPLCGNELDERDLHVRFTLPDPVLRLDAAEREGFTGPDIISVPRIGSFARVLLPISLTGGFRLTIGTWLGLTERAVYERAVQLWQDPAYETLELEGELANEIQPWGWVLGAKAQAAVQKTTEVPYVTAVLSRRAKDLVSEIWPRDQIMRAFPDELWHRRADGPSV